MSTAASINLNHQRAPRGEHAKPKLRVVGPAKKKPTNNLRAFMFEHGITEADLWQVAKTSQNFVNRIRNGHVSNPRVVTCWRIVKALRVLTGNPSLAFEAIWPEAVS